MIFLYRFFYTLAKTLISLLYPFLGENLQKWIQLRRFKADQTHNFKNTYWFHAASGEIEYCKSVIRLLRAEQPEAQIVVTYTSPSAEKLFKNIASAINQFIPLTWDQPSAVNELLDYINPALLIFSRTDLWPELITQAKKRNIKMGLISYNPRFGFLSPLTQGYLLPKFDFISCLSDETRKRLQTSFNLKNISVDGDPRFDQVFFRLQQPSVLQIKSPSPIMVWGSTWPEDEDVLFQCIQPLLSKGLKIILSPHEVSQGHIETVLQRLIQNQLSYQLLSVEKDEQNISFTADVLVIDKIGYLADAYRFGVLAFVGGSFKEKIHSVMEPLCSGLVVLTGPFYKNNPEAALYQNKYVFSVETPEELISLCQHYTHENNLDIAAEMQKNLNASQRILKIISNTLLKKQDF
jgi:3-deoxy-D-manno-octulosonic-acid transferase